MTLRNVQDAEEVLEQGTQDFRLKIILHPVTQIRLFFTGKQKLNVDQFGVGPSIHRVHFLSPFGELIQKGIEKGYKVSVSREGSNWSFRGWYLEFIKINCST